MDTLSKFSAVFVLVYQSTSIFNITSVQHHVLRVLKLTGRYCIKNTYCTLILQLQVTQSRIFEPKKRLNQPEKLKKRKLNNKCKRKNATTRTNKRSTPENRRLILNLNFGSMETTSILERQSFTITDFALYVANIYNLLFGMSFVSFMEVLLEMAIQFVKFFGWMFEFCMVKSCLYHNISSRVLSNFILV